jgi:hypothetical protein
MRTTPAERMIKCREAAKFANRRSLSPHLLSGDDVWAVMTAARGRCVYCGSPAVEKKPSKVNGTSARWAQFGRRIGTLEHLRGLARGGDNDPSNLAWACLWCNTSHLERERRKGATDHGGFHPPPDDPAAIRRLVRQNLLARLRLRLKKTRDDENWDEWLETARRLEIELRAKLKPADREKVSELTDWHGPETFDDDWLHWGPGGPGWLHE